MWTGDSCHPHLSVHCPLVFRARSGRLSSIPPGQAKPQSPETVSASSLVTQPICRLLRPPASPQLTSYSGCSSTGLCPIATSSRAIPEWTHLDSTIFAWSRWPSSMSTGDIWKLLMGIDHSCFSELLQPSLVCVPNKQPFVRPGLHCPPECVSAQVQIWFQYCLVCGTA